MQLYHAIIHILFPPKCLLCGSLLHREETDLCRSCRMNGPLLPNCKRKLQFLDSFTAVWYYEGYVRRSLLHFKFYGKRHYAKGYGRLLAMELQKGRTAFDVLTWIPVSRRRKLARGYDQVELIAKAVGAELGITPVATLKKIRHTRAQSGIQGTAQRRANVLGAYRCLNPQSLKDKRVLLLDDILTTGATASEAARTLKIAGAKEVHCGTVAAARKE